MAWEVTGNAGTNPATNFLGTTDNEPLVIRTKGTERLRIDSAGNIGIGTTRPGDFLHIYNNGAAYLRTEANNGAGSYRAFEIGTGSDYNFHIYDQTVQADRLSISWATGNVGIGTTMPSAKLTVDPQGAGGIVIGNPDAVQGGFTNLLLDISAASGGYASIQAIKSSGLQGGRFTTVEYGDLALNPAAGNVGIGTTMPSAKLTVDPQGAGGIVIGNPSTGQGGFTSLLLDISAASGGYASIQAIKSSGTEYGDLALNPAAGNVGIGTISPGAKLEVNGDVMVTGDIILTGADCAEEFDIAEATHIEAGTVMVLDQEGGLQESQRAYDKRVAGVISGAGDYRPGLILDRQQSRDNRLPVALIGKVYCKVDAQYASIEIGDLLTTSPTPGCAMKADDPFKAFGSVIGKALRPLQVGQGLIPILIALQ